MRGMVSSDECGFKPYFLPPMPSKSSDFRTLPTETITSLRPIPAVGSYVDQGLTCAVTNQVLHLLGRGREAREDSS